MHQNRLFIDLQSIISGLPKINVDNAFLNIIHHCTHFRYRPAQTRKKMFAYNKKYAKFSNFEPYATTVPNNFQMKILSSTKSFSLKKL